MSEPRQSFDFDEMGYSRKEAPMTDQPTIPENRRPPEGHIWKCGACGKRAEDLYGMIGHRSQGWDESCVLNAVAVPHEGATP